MDNLEAKEHIEKKEHIHTKATRTSGSAENIKNIEASDGSRYDLLATSFDLEDDDDESEEETELQQAGNKASSKQLYEKPSTITCDSCERTEGTRYYRCRTCDDFDLCERCYVDRRLGCKIDIRHRFDKTRWIDGKECIIR